jgi:hypothetical protein
MRAAPAGRWGEAVQPPSAACQLAAVVARAAIVATLVLSGASLAATPPAYAADPATWRFAPAVAPPAPSGQPPAPYPVPVGQVGDISFWAPNRGLLITGGTEGRWRGSVAPGLYAYNGVEWHQLSTVCGGADGRIAWAGPDEFWTISDQREGQLLSGSDTGSGQFQSLSLCHFLNGQVVGSYALPLEQPNSYLPMDAAACYGPSDCWFGGEDGTAGAFHLHWDGSTVSEVYEPEDHAIMSMINFNGQIYESVIIRSSDRFLPAENASHPAVVHAIAPAGSTQPQFSDQPLFTSPLQPPVQRLPLYGENVLPQALRGFSLASEADGLGESATLWAAADPVNNGELTQGTKPAHVTVLRYSGGAWSQLLPNAGGDPPPLETEKLVGASAIQGEEVSGANETIAPEPGGEDAWLSLEGPTVALLTAHGAIAEIDRLPNPEEPIGAHGNAGPIVCPASHDCWMATNEGSDAITQEGAVSGWLFHLTAGAQYEQGPQFEKDTDPNFNKLITERPPDEGVPVVYPDLPPVDDSLANQQFSAATQSGAPLQTPAPVSKTTTGPRKALIAHVHSKLVNRRKLILSFTLTARARVQLIARRKKAIVARSRAESLSAGKHQLSLLLNPLRWPTGFQFKATPAGAAAPSGGSEEAGSGDTIST